MIDHIINYEIIGNKIVVKFENSIKCVEFSKPEAVKFYDYKSNDSDIIEGSNIKYDIRFKGKELTIRTSELTVKIYSNFRIDIYDTEGKLLCENYQGNTEEFVK